LKHNFAFVDALRERYDQLQDEALRSLLNRVWNHQTNIDEALSSLRQLPFTNLGFAKLDTHRTVRTGFPEVVFCSGKEVEHVAAIVEKLAQGPGPVLATRATPPMFEAVQALTPDARYHSQARIIVVERSPLPKRSGVVMVISAGTSDIPVAEEAAVTAEVMGNSVDRLFDVGVAGLHRLLAHVDSIMAARVLIVVAGMEGALPSVVGGLVRRPVIAVPTSVGYGASFNGLAALLGMLNSCASGVTVVNIDNGFGAGFAASLINSIKEE
jgi:hypothetical protein